MRKQRRLMSAHLTRLSGRDKREHKGCAALFAERFAGGGGTPRLFSCLIQAPVRDTEHTKGCDFIIHLNRQYQVKSLGCLLLPWCFCPPGLCCILFQHCH
ncbi:unnamed protein product [Pylaiella littoralis]